MKLDSWLAGIATIVSIAFTFIIAWPILKTNIPFTGKISNFFLLLTWLASFGSVYYILKLFSKNIFMLYRKITGIKEEEILFTDSKIKSTNKTWVICNEIKKITSVNFSSAKNNELIFKGTETKPGKNPVKYTINIPVPAGEMRNAEKVYEYLKRNWLDINVSLLQQPSCFTCLNEIKDSYYLYILSGKPCKKISLTGPMHLLKAVYFSSVYWLFIPMVLHNLILAITLLLMPGSMAL